MKEILKFVLMFLICYTLLIYVCNLNGIQLIINKFFRSTVELFVKTALPEAYLDTQNYLDNDHKIDPNVFYVVYGNPSVIKAEKEYATKQAYMEYKISTYSIQFYIFQMLTVPVVFLISIFLATPIRWQVKLTSLGISLLLLCGLIISKCIFFTLFSIANSNIGIYTLSDSALSIVSRTVSMLTLGFSIIISFCLWLLFGFRNSGFSSQFSNFIKSFQ